MAQQTPPERQTEALEQIVVKLEAMAKALVDIKTKLTSLTTAVRRGRDRL